MIALREAVAAVAEPPVAVALSGGLDSSLIAHLAVGQLGKGMSHAVRGYVFSVGGDTHDLRAAREAANLMGIRLKEIIVGQEEVEAAAAEMGRAVGITDRFTVSFELPLWFVAREAAEAQVLLGQGADELFGGYARYGKLEGEALREALSKDASALDQVVEREEKIAARFGKEFHYPYLDREVVDFAASLPPERKVGPAGRKLVLRKAALRAGLPEPLARKPKKAAQYGSGAWRAMKRREGQPKGNEE
jgi:asparagine synthase (glutamine-hydrolysing)